MNIINDVKKPAGNQSLDYKPDWEETKNRYRLWWDHEYFGRCALAVTAPQPNLPDTEPPEAESVEQKWLDLDWISRDNEYRLSRTYFGGESFPIWNAGYSGVSGLSTLLGSPLDLDMETGWCHPLLTAQKELKVDHLTLDESNYYYQFTMAMLRRAACESRGKSIPSIGAWGGSGDTLATLRGTEHLLMDCIEQPESVRAAEKYLMDMWFDFFDRCYSIVHEISEGSSCWFRLWAPGKFYAAQNDFSYNIGPDMFRDLFLPDIRRQIEFLDYSVYHLDGINAFRHLDALCEIPKLHAIQVLPGAGKPSPLYYVDTLKKVQAAGKNLHITIDAEEVEQALSLLSARGLFIETSVASKDEADSLLKQAGKWSVDRG